MIIYLVPKKRTRNESDDWATSLHKEFVIPGIAVNQNFYLEVLARLRWAIRVGPEISGNWIMHHENAPAHSAIVCEFVMKKFISLLLQPNTSPDQSLCDSFLKLKLNAQDYRTHNNNNIQEVVTDIMKSLPRDDF